MTLCAVRGSSCANISKRIYILSNLTRNPNFQKLMSDGLSVKKKVMESSNCENEDPQISEEQKQILERLKCLNNGENTIHQSAVRLNFGLKVFN